MTKRVLLPLAEGFEEIEALACLDLLRRGGVEVVTAGLAPGLVTAGHGLRVAPDTTLDAVADESFDLVLLPGGSPGYVNLAADERVRALARRQVAAQRPVAAICGAPYVLEQSGLLAGHRVTSYPSVRPKLTSAAAVVEDRVVTDGQIITSQGVGTAIEFALALLEMLTDRETRDRVARATLVEA
ncbi:MAG TPA: DJ-1 family glyoxalase III [bacterium]|jgi:4-methyl-5(b-hydroxyethyl)-thiazole monophosphate biosynthesis